MTRVILDTDLAMGAPGSDIDDGFALALAHLDPGIRLELVTTVGGNADVESATMLSLELLRRLGATVPVVRGAAAPLLHPGRHRVPNESVLRDFGHLRPEPGHAAVELVRRVMAEPGEITIVAIGPLTNIAVAMNLEPRFAESVAELVIMGGVFLGQKHETGSPGEFNVTKDPEAAAAILASGARQRWVGLDVTQQVRLSLDDARALERADPEGFGAFAGRYTSAWIDTLSCYHPGDPVAQDSCAMHDPLAIAAVARPELLEWRPASVAVVTGESFARGMTVTDLLFTRGAPEPNCTIAVGVDAEAFRAYFLSTLASGQRR